MSDAPKARNSTSEYETELRIAKGFDLICDPPGDAATERLNLLKERLLILFLRLQRGDLSYTEVKAHSRCIQDSRRSFGPWMIGKSSLRGGTGAETHL
jgi:hypothetical protein